MSKLFILNIIAFFCLLPNFDTVKKILQSSIKQTLSKYIFEIIKSLSKIDQNNKQWTTQNTYTLYGGELLFVFLHEVCQLHEETPPVPSIHSTPVPVLVQI